MLLFWHKLTAKGKFCFIDKTTSHWSIHFEQHYIFCGNGIRNHRFSRK